MPRTVTFERVFHHCTYIAEQDARPVPVKTDQAYKVDDKVVMFL